MHLCVDTFDTDSPANSTGNVWRRLDFSWMFWLSLKELRMLRKRDCQGRLSFHFFERWMTDLVTNSRQKKSKQCPGKICRGSESVFLHGVKWESLIVHRTHLQRGLQRGFDWTPSHPPFFISYEKEIIWSLSETKLFHFHGIFKKN